MLAFLVSQGGGARRMLVDSLAFQIEKSGCLDAFWGQAGSWRGRGVGSCLVRATLHDGCPFRARASTDACGGGGGGSGGCFRAKRRCLRRGRIACCVFPSVVINRLRPSIPMRAWSPSAWRPRIRLRAGEASSWSLLRDPLSVFLPPAEANAQAPLSFHEGGRSRRWRDARRRGVGDLARALEERGYANTGELDGPGRSQSMAASSTCTPQSRLSRPHRFFFGDEVDEIRRIVPSTGQTVATLKSVEVYPVAEFSCTRIALARARKAIERQAQTNPALRDILEKTRRRPAFRRVGRFASFICMIERSRSAITPATGCCRFSWSRVLSSMTLRTILRRFRDAPRERAFN